MSLDLNLCFDLPQQGFGELGQLRTWETVTSGMITDTHLDLQQWTCMRYSIIMHTNAHHCKPHNRSHKLAWHRLFCNKLVKYIRRKSHYFAHSVSVHKGIHSLALSSPLSIYSSSRCLPTSANLLPPSLPPCVTLFPSQFLNEISPRYVVAYRMPILTS